MRRHKYVRVCGEVAEIVGGGCLPLPEGDPFEIASSLLLGRMFAILSL